MGGIIKKMKERIAKSGSSKKEVLYFGKDTVKRVRFLQDLDDGFEFKFHNDYDAKIWEPCHDPEDPDNCPLCKDGIYTQDTYVWSVWDYDSNAVKLLHTKVTGVSPVPALIEMNDEYGTLLDRDFKIKKVGGGTDGKYVVTPLDKKKFDNKKAKPYTLKQVTELFAQAYNKDDDADDEEDDDEDEKPKSKKPSKEKEAPKGKGKKEEKKKAKKEPTLREKFEELEMDQLKMVGVELGMTKKELKAFDDEEEIIDEFFDNYEEEDLQEIYDNLGEEEEDED